MRLGVLSSEEMTSEQVDLYREILSGPRGQEPRCVLRDAGQRALANRAVYCGNNLSAAMVRQMTPHEVEFFQKLDPPKAFTLDPSATAPFVIVFIDPPTGVTRFDVSVASAIKNAPLTETTSG